MMIHLFSALKKRCNLVSVIAEVDRILRPQGTFINDTFQIWRRSDLCSEVMVASYRGRDHYIGDSK
uniref:Methyltransferase n=1 Tax=Brassica oleracea TaxID=3712 RepID=A0A3P6FCS4_BRAOL|nr:unnamed protein product [Brassica oleracea]